MPLGQFLIEDFYVALDKERRKRRTSWSKVGKECGIPPSTFTRIGQGNHISLTNMASLALWADLDVNQFIKRT